MFSNKRPYLSYLLLLAFGCLVSRMAESQTSFDHAKTKHRTLNCSKCHSVSVTQPDVKRFPGHIACADCHDFSEMATSKYAVFCTICHSGKPESAAQPALFSFPKPGVPTDFGISFSHIAHLKAGVKAPGFPAAVSGQTLKCADCHFKVQPIGGKIPVPEMVLDRPHPNCFRCHGPTPADRPAMNECAGCHALAGTKPPHLYGIVQDFKHEDHQYDIRPKKKSEVRMKIDLCSECHASVVRSAGLKEIKLPETGYCASCHNGKLGLPDPLSKTVLNSLSRR